jgi:hypothetical protein
MSAAVQVENGCSAMSEMGHFLPPRCAPGGGGTCFDSGLGQAREPPDFGRFFSSRPICDNVHYHASDGRKHDGRCADRPDPATPEWVLSWRFNTILLCLIFRRSASRLEPREISILAEIPENAYTVPTQPL